MSEFHPIEKVRSLSPELQVNLLGSTNERSNCRVQRLMWAATGTEPVREALEVDLVYLVEDRHHGLLNDLVLQRRDAQRTLPPVSLRYKDSS